MCEWCSLVEAEFDEVYLYDHVGGRVEYELYVARVGRAREVRVDVLLARLAGRVLPDGSVQLLELVPDVGARVVVLVQAYTTTAQQYTVQR